MGILREFERRLEGAVEGFFARAFRSGLQPVELAKAVQRYASHYKQVDVDGIIVPNVYRIELSGSDAERFHGYGEAMRHELAGVVHRTARERGWRLRGPVRIEIRVSDDIRPGTYELRGKIESAARPESPSRQRPAEAPAAPVVATASSQVTQVLPPAPAPSRAAVTIVSGAGAGQRLRVTPGSTMGRLPGCEVTLDDPSVSRRHARLDQAGGEWTIKDLGSTNGVKVNGRKVEQATLRSDDEIELGSVRLTFAEEADG
jgi:hypothetical protein